MLSAIGGECPMPPSGCSWAPLWFCTQPTRRLDTSSITRIIITRFRELFFDARPRCTQGVLDPRGLPCDLLLASGAPVFRPAEFIAGDAHCRQLGPYRAMHDDPGFSLVQLPGVRRDHGCFVFFGRDSRRPVSQARWDVARFVGEPAS